ncbi:hypothetical protein C8F04DRAFT_1197747 [Mycena alexandri]|uniref:Uncharacterized protein n=1 Tax=Mycena alexandri TaxID=1745969 RepID=A0AAD6S2Q2_9AGAR|nr:hypothetical protein C8F04DRAFT_1197747 [Mycena alexandri]
MRRAGACSSTKEERTPSMTYDVFEVARCTQGITYEFARRARRMREQLDEGSRRQRPKWWLDLYVVMRASGSTGTRRQYVESVPSGVGVQAEEARARAECRAAAMEVDEAAGSRGNPEEATGKIVAYAARDRAYTKFHRVRRSTMPIWLEEAGVALSIEIQELQRFRSRATEIQAAVGISTRAFRSLHFKILVATEKPFESVRRTESQTMKGELTSGRSLAVASLGEEGATLVHSLRCDVARRWEKAEAPGRTPISLFGLPLKNSTLKSRVASSGVLVQFKGKGGKLQNPQMAELASVENTEYLSKILDALEARGSGRGCAASRVKDSAHRRRFKRRRRICRSIVLALQGPMQVPWRARLEGAKSFERRARRMQREAMFACRRRSSEDAQLGRGEARADHRSQRPVGAQVAAGEFTLTRHLARAREVELMDDGRGSSVRHRLEVLQRVEIKPRWRSRHPQRGSPVRLRGLVERECIRRYGAQARTGELTYAGNSERERGHGGVAKDEGRAGRITWEGGARGERTLQREGMGLHEELECERAQDIPRRVRPAARTMSRAGGSTGAVHTESLRHGQAIAQAGRMHEGAQAEFTQKGSSSQSAKPDAFVGRRRLVVREWRRASRGSGASASGRRSSADADLYARETTAAHLPWFHVVGVFALERAQVTVRPVVLGVTAGTDAARPARDCACNAHMQGERYKGGLRVRSEDVDLTLYSTQKRRSHPWWRKVRNEDGDGVRVRARQSRGAEMSWKMKETEILAAESGLNVLKPAVQTFDWSDTMEERQRSLKSLETSSTPKRPCAEVAADACLGVATNRTRWWRERGRCRRRLLPRCRRHVNAAGANVSASVYRTAFTHIMRVERGERGRARHLIQKYPRVWARIKREVEDGLEDVVTGSLGCTSELTLSAELKDTRVEERPEGPSAQQEGSAEGGGGPITWAESSVEGYSVKETMRVGGIFVKGLDEAPAVVTIVKALGLRQALVNASMTRTESHSAGKQLMPLDGAAPQDAYPGYPRSGSCDLEQGADGEGQCSAPEFVALFTLRR